MNLKIFLPFQVYAEKTGIARIVAETDEGSFGLLPNRLDCVAALVPGILVFQPEGECEAYLAVDEGILIKTGKDVLVSVHNAMEGTDLETLREAVRDEFLNLDAHEQHMRRMMAKMESGFIRRFSEIYRE